ncbi:MAG: hypothetical protein ABIF19_01365 [Planctomycetota bacterium]
MSMTTAFILANFTIPEKIGVNPQSMLWLLPLVAAISIVYKATKVPKINIVSFAKETGILFGSIVVFMVVTALALYAFAWLITE